MIDEQLDDMKPLPDSKAELLERIELARRRSTTRWPG